jgi:release factor glutamine methyltransferase
LARIFGSISFCDLHLKMSEGVFEPMVETESLTQHALLLLQNRQAPLRILDIGTGSGAVLLALLNKFPHASGVGLDCCDRAIELAQENARLNQRESRAEFLKRDLLQGVEGKFDLIISNLPHVPSSLIPHLLPEVRLYNPAHTLDGGRDGLQSYRRLLVHAPRRMTADGLLICQTSPKSAPYLMRIFETAGFKSPKILHNYYGVPVGVRAGKNAYRRSAISLLKQYVALKTGMF